MVLINYCLIPWGQVHQEETHVSDPNAWFIFNLHRNSFYSWHTHIFKRVQICCWVKKRNPLTWEGSPSFIAANFPSTQVPCSKPTALRLLHFPSPTAPTPIIHYPNLFLHTKMTLTSLILLLGTITDVKKFTFSIMYY